MKNSIFFVSILFFIQGCSDAPIASNTINLKVFNPVVKDTSYYTEYVAEIAAVQFAEIRSQVSGLVEQIHVSEGTQVSKGTLLVSLNQEFLMQELLAAKARLKESESNYRASKLKFESSKKLLENKIISQAELDVLGAELEAMASSFDNLTAQVVEAEINLGFTKIAAPFNGVVGRFNFKVGSLVEVGDVITEMSNDSEIFTYFNLPEVEYLAWAQDSVKIIGMPVNLILANRTSYPFQGVVESIDNVIDQATGNIGIKARFKNNGLVKHGSSGKIQLLQTLTGGVLIPQKSVLDIQGELFVYTVDNQKLVKRRRVTPLGRLPHWYVVSSNGLESSLEIVLEGIQLISEGQKVESKITSLTNL